jgi:hypothetical protein
MGEIIFLVMKLIWYTGLAISLPLFCIIMVRLVLEVRGNSPRIASPSQRKRYWERYDPASDPNHPYYRNLLPYETRWKDE